MKKLRALFAILLVVCMLSSMAFAETEAAEIVSETIDEVVVTVESSAAGETGDPATDPKDDEASATVKQDPHYSNEENLISEVKPTCTEKGSKTYKCLHCDSPFTVEIPALDPENGHEGEVIEKQITTCEKQGYDLIKECTKCGAKNVKNYYDEPLAPHSYDHTKDIVVEATCTTAKKITNTCVVCGKTFTWEEGEALGHDYVPAEVKDATCTAEGASSSIYACSRCGAIDPEKHDAKVLEKLNHGAKVEDYFVYLTKDNASEYVNPLAKDSYADDWGWWIEELGYEYEKDGSKFNLNLEKDYKLGADGFYRDSEGKKVCVASTQPVGKTIIAATDIYCRETVTYVLPTCDKTGSVTVKCDACGYEKTETIPAMGHKYTLVDNSAWSTEDADCTKGIPVEYRCQVCEAVYESKIPAHASHDFTENTWYNEDLGREDSNVTYIQKKAGDYEAREYQKDEICEGLDYVKVIHCNNNWCSKTKTVEVKGVESKHGGKEEGYRVYQAPTCTEDGFELNYCSKCGTAWRTVVPALGHVTTKEANIKIDTKPTCTTEGVRNFYCDRCGKVWKSERVPALGHVWEKDTKASKDFTCFADGLLVEKCTRCGEVRQTVQKAHHVYETDENGNPVNVFDYKAATCTTAGYVTYNCEVCHAPIEKEVIPAKKHDRERAGYVHKDVATDILYEGIWYQNHTAATCKDPETYSYTCEDCGKLVKKTVGTANPDAHEKFYTWTDGEAKEKGFVITTFPTCVAEGVAYYNCGICKKVVEVKLNKLPHNMVTSFDVKAGKYVTKCEPLTKDELPKYKTQIDAIAPTLYDLLSERSVKTDRWIYWDEEAGKEVEETVTYDSYIAGIGCGKSDAVALKPTKYDVAKNGKYVTIDLQKDTLPVQDPLVYVVWSYTLSDGTNFSYERTFEPTWDEKLEWTSYKYNIGNPKTPSGATLDFILVIVTNDEDVDNITDANANDFGYAMIK